MPVLREFRDHYLLTDLPGRHLVEFYYRHSPAVAAVIARPVSLRAVTHWLLTAVVFAIEYPSYFVLFFAVLTIGMLF